MEQVIVAGYPDLLHTTNTEYNRLYGGFSWFTTEGNREQLVSTDGVIKNLRIELNGVPGTGTYVFTLRLNGNPTTLTCEVAADGTIASDTDPAHAVTVTGGDRICLECNPNSPDTARYAIWTTMFESDNAKESLILGGISSILNDGITEYNWIAGTGNPTWSSGEVIRIQPIPTAGKIKNLYVKLSADPGNAPDAYKFTLRLDNNGGMQSTALTVTITADDTTGFNVVDEITVAAGDIVSLMCEPLNAPAVEPFALWGMTFEADTDGESVILGGTNDNASSSVPEYISLTGGYGTGFWTTTEAGRYSLGQACLLKKLYILLQNAPSVDDNFTFTVRLEGASPGGGLAVIIADTATSGNDTINDVTVLDGNTLGLQSIPFSSPTTGDVWWGLVSYIEPPVVGWAGGDVLGVAIATIAKINGVALADITEVNGIA